MEAFSHHFSKKCRVRKCRVQSATLLLAARLLAEKDMPKNMDFPHVASVIAPSKASGPLRNTCWLLILPRIVHSVTNKSSATKSLNMPLRNTIFPIVFAEKLLNLIMPSFTGTWSHTLMSHNSVLVVIFWCPPGKLVITPPRSTAFQSVLCVMRLSTLILGTFINT